MIAVRRRAGRRPRPGRRRGRGRRRRLRRAVHARHAGRGCASASRPGCATSLVVREDSLTLYGFADDDERAVFELLQTASGVGPRLAQAMLAVHTPGRAAPRGRHRGPRGAHAVPGIGTKGAQTDRARAQGPARRARRHRGRRAPPAAAPRRRAAGASRCTPPCSGWARPPREADEAVAAVAPAGRRPTAAAAEPHVARAAAGRPADPEPRPLSRRHAATGSTAHRSDA